VLSKHPQNVNFAGKAANKLLQL